MRLSSSATARSIRAITVVAAVCACALAHAQVKVDNAWVRGAVPGQLTTGAFLDVTSKSDAKLVKVESPIAAVVEIHMSEMKNDLMTMRAVPSVALPAGKQVRFAPGGYHIMLMDLKQPVKNGEAVPLKLIVESADGKREMVEVKAQVRGVGTSQQTHQH